MSKPSPARIQTTHFDLDAVFAELGEFGRYQRFVFFYICIAIFVYGHVTLTYVFTAGDINYRQVFELN